MRRSSFCWRFLFFFLIHEIQTCWVTCWPRNETRNVASFFFQYQWVISQTIALHLQFPSSRIWINGSAVQRSACAVIGLQADENFIFKLSTDVILITVHTGREARRKLGEECRESKERNTEMGRFFRELEEILEYDERQNNQINELRPECERLELVVDIVAWQY